MFETTNQKIFWTCVRVLEIWFAVNCAIKFDWNIQKQTSLGGKVTKLSPLLEQKWCQAFSSLTWRFKGMINKGLSSNRLDRYGQIVQHSAFGCLPSSLLRSASIRENQYLQSRQSPKTLSLSIVCFLQTALSCFNNLRLLKVSQNDVPN